MISLVFDTLIQWKALWTIPGFDNASNRMLPSQALQNQVVFLLEKRILFAVVFFSLVCRGLWVLGQSGFSFRELLKSSLDLWSNNSVDFGSFAIVKENPPFERAVYSRQQLDISTVELCSSAKKYSFFCRPWALKTTLNWMIQKEKQTCSAYFPIVQDVMQMTTTR